MFKFKKVFEKELKELEKLKETQLTVSTLLDILELEKMSDDEILKKYKYKKWEDMDRNIVKYLERKYHVLPICPFAISIYPEYFKDECFGETYERLQRNKKKLEEQQNDN